MGFCVLGQIHYNIRTVVILAYFEAGRGEKAQQNPVVWILEAEGFKNGAALFKFAEGGAVHPDIGAGAFSQLLFQFFEKPPAAISPKPGFGVPLSGQTDTEVIDRQKQSIKKDMHR